jgi:hypothetical protein
VGRRAGGARGRGRGRFSILGRFHGPVLFYTPSFFRSRRVFQQVFRLLLRSGGSRLHLVSLRKIEMHVRTQPIGPYVTALVARYSPVVGAAFPAVAPRAARSHQYRLVHKFSVNQLPIGGLSRCNELPRFRRSINRAGQIDNNSKAGFEAARLRAPVLIAGYESQSVLSRTRAPFVTRWSRVSSGYPDSAKDGIFRGIY